jgi:hypothetical protein
LVGIEDHSNDLVHSAIAVDQLLLSGALFDVSISQGAQTHARYRI